MIFSVMTLFPDMIRQALSESIIGRAVKDEVISLRCFDIRDYSTDKHRRVDDYPFGGGGGMVMRCQPIYDCYQDLVEKTGVKPHTVYLSPRGTVLTQKKAKELSALPHLAILCGHYEGVDQRILDEIIDEEISIGDYVLTGGELPACVLIDCITRMLPGVLAAESAYENESHYNGLLEHPQYTQPRCWKEREVPAVLTEGNHRLIEKWKREESLRITAKMRPDLLRRPVPDGKRLRFPAKEDQEQLLTMMQAFYQTPGVLHDIPPAHIQATLDRIYGGAPDINAYLIQFERKTAGYCLLSHAYSNEAGGLTVWIEEVYILPDFRGHKLADKALREIFRLYGSSAKRYRMEITPDNLSARSIYARLGFKDLDYRQMIRE